MNFVFISPNFPETFRHFCIRLKENGVNVLGIGDAPYDELHPDLRSALTEYYRVDTLENYEAMVRAVGYFTYRYGKVDWLESNNEYWLEQDAALRTEFNITTGPKLDKINSYKSKQAMKDFYRKAGVPVARCHPVSTIEAAREFIKEVGYPVIVKPDNGVGANATYRLANDEDLENFYFWHPDVPYLMEEFINGVVTTYDGICNSKGEVLFAASHVSPNAIMDMVNEGAACYYYVTKEVPPEVEKAGKATLKAFDVRSRFFHLEFFRLVEGKPGLGEKGDIVALEVNMRPAGGFTTEMLNHGQCVDVYQIWADMVAYDERRHTYGGTPSTCMYAGRRDGVNYELTLQELQEQCGEHARLFTRMPDALAGCMGNQVAIVCYETLEEALDFVKTAFRVKE